LDNTTAIFIGIICLIIFGSLLVAGIKIQNKAFPKTTLEQGYKNAIFSILITYTLIACIVGTIVYFIFNQSANATLGISIIFLWIVTYLFFSYTWMNNKRKAGYILLDIMPFPNKYLFILFACGTIIQGILGDFSFGLLNGSPSRYVSIMIGLSLAIFCFLIAFSRIQIRENGILIYIDLIKWEKIESFTWVFDSKKAHTLKFTYKGRLPAFMRNGVLPVPIEKKAELAAILEKNSSKMSLISKSA
jgi:hypothetical protein